MNARIVCEFISSSVWYLNKEERCLKIVGDFKSVTIKWDSVNFITSIIIWMPPWKLFLDHVQLFPLFSLFELTDRRFVRRQFNFAPGFFEWKNFNIYPANTIPFEISHFHATENVSICTKFVTYIHLYHVFIFWFKCPAISSDWSNLYLRWPFQPFLIESLNKYYTVLNMKICSAFFFICIQNFRTEPTRSALIKGIH